MVASHPALVDFGKIPLNIEEVFASKGRTKILHMLIQKSGHEMSITDIVKQTRCNHDNIAGHLRALQKLGFVQEKTFGRVRIFRLIVEDKRVRALVNVVDLWENKPLGMPGAREGAPWQV